VQALLQAPQLAASAIVFTQLSPHCTVGAAQVAVHPVDPQRGAAAPQTTPQPPQLFGSVVLTHAPRQL